MVPCKVQKLKVKFLAFLFSAIFIAIFQIGFSLVDELGFVFIEFLPLILSLNALQFLIDWSKICFDGKAKCYCFVFNLILSLITLPIFLGVYFGIMNPVHSIHYEKVENCQVIGIAPMAQASYEVYSILYVDFEYEQQKFLGHACTSDQWDNSSNYNSVSKYDKIACDDVGSSYDTPYNKRVRLLKTQQSQKEEISASYTKRNLRVRGKCSQTGKSWASPYTFSNIKLSSWMCQPRNKQSYEQLTQNRSCYVNFREIREKSYQNSKNRLNLRETYFFAMVVFDKPVYYPRLGLIALIILTFYPSNMLVYPIFKHILLKFRDEIFLLFAKVEQNYQSGK